MPVADEDARAFMLPADDDPESQRTTRSISPALDRRSVSYTRRSFNSERPGDWKAQISQNVDKLNRRGLQIWNRLTPLQRILLIIANIILLVLAILVLIYNESIFRAFVPYAKGWRKLPAGWLILWFGIVIVSFPPLIGYSTLLTLAGFVYGFPQGWFVVSTATICGSAVAFIASRSVLKSYVDRWVAGNKKFDALSLTLKHDGLKLLIMIRLCPLPYSFSNGAIATIPTVSWVSFALATACVTPKLLIHVFVGARLGEIAEKGEEMDGKTKAVSYLSIIIGLAAGLITGWFMYKKATARARELEAEEREHVRNASIDQLEREYADDPSALEAAEHIREQEDDISLRETAGDYHDDPRDDVADVFGVGDEDDDLLSPKPN